MIKYIVYLFLSFTFLFSQPSQSLYNQDRYYLDNNEVLLYKIINWWYIESNANSTKLCNKPIKIKTNDIKLKYNENKKELTVYKKGEFSKLISLKSGSDKDLKFIFSNLSKKEYLKLKNISLVVEGKVRGLLDYSGKLALYDDGQFYRKCPNVVNKSKIVFMLVDNSSDEVFLKSNILN